MRRRNFQARLRAEKSTDTMKMTSSSYRTGAKIIQVFTHSPTVLCTLQKRREVLRILFQLLALPSMWLETLLSFFLVLYGLYFWTRINVVLTSHGLTKLTLLVFSLGTDWHMCTNTRTCRNKTNINVGERREISKLEAVRWITVDISRA